MKHSRSSWASRFVCQEMGETVRRAIHALVVAPAESAHFDAHHDQDQGIAVELAADTPTTADTAALRAVADQLEHVIANGEPEQAEALLAILTRRPARQQPQRSPAPLQRRHAHGLRAELFSGASRARTDGLRHAMATLSQLSYSPGRLHGTG
jgi:hypothetical protein